MDSWPRSREIEKPKPIRERAANASSKLLLLKNSIIRIHGDRSPMLDDLTEAIFVLEAVAKGTSSRSVA